MKRVRLGSILGLVLGCAALAAADPITRASFHSDDIKGPIIVSGAPLGKPAALGFAENMVPGSEATLGNISLTAFGTIVVQNPTQPVWDIRAQAVCTIWFEDGSTILGSFRTTGTFDPATGIITTTGHYVFTSGTGKFARVRGAGTLGASGPVSDAVCHMDGWMEY
jgi:hypothetical protein